MVPTLARNYLQNFRAFSLLRRFNALGYTAWPDIIDGSACVPLCTWSSFTSWFYHRRWVVPKFSLGFTVHYTVVDVIFTLMPAIEIHPSSALQQEKEPVLAGAGSAIQYSSPASTM